MEEFLYTTIDEYLAKEGLSDLFRNEFLASCISAIYNQDMSINAVAGFVNLYGSQYPAYKLEGGND